MNNSPHSHTTFDWAIYANATFAGLAVLFPIPIIDWLLEAFFRRRILSSIVNRRGHQLSPQVIRLLNNEQFGFKSCLSGCFTLPFVFTFWLIKKISRKIIYFLTIKEATDQLSYYWHQAFLLDYMLLRGHLKDEQTALLAREAMTQVLESITISPLIQLARQIMSSPRYILATIRQARLGSPPSDRSRAPTPRSSGHALGGKRASHSIRSSNRIGTNLKTTLNGSPHTMSESMRS